MVRARDVAAYLISEKCPTGRVQVQKLLYYAQGWSLAWTGKPLFDDPIEAWEKGPVVRSVYSGDEDCVPSPHAETLDSEAKMIVDSVWDFYGQYCGSELIARTHEEEPWMTTPRNETISLNVISRTLARQALVDGSAKTPARPAILVRSSQEAFRRAHGSAERRWKTVNKRLAAL